MAPYTHIHTLDLFDIYKNNLQKKEKKDKWNKLHKNRFQPPIKYLFLWVTMEMVSDDTDNTHDTVRQAHCHIWRSSYHAPLNKTILKFMICLFSFTFWKTGCQTSALVLNSLNYSSLLSLLFVNSNLIIVLLQTQQRGLHKSIIRGGKSIHWFWLTPRSGHSLRASLMEL